jgi:hypothetical protein
VPQWHQEEFFEPGVRKLAYMDLCPDRQTLADGRVIVQNSRFKNPPSRCFVQRDLYSTFFGAAVNDEIERKLFGAVDTSGAPAVKAFTGSDVSAWHTHFQTLFTYLDIQKLRTPKGLDWLRAQYPTLSQNELMQEMQGLQMINCTIWTEGVREIVSAENSAVKFILSDHPVTTFNSAVPPDAAGCAYPLDPSIALKGSQTIFPLSRDFCLILTNLEYAQDSAANALEKRTFARNYRSSMARTDAFIRTRKLSDAEVGRINMAIKARARRYIAAGQEAWLHPEQPSPPTWAEIAATLRPPEHETWRFGGQVFAKMADGEVLYQDEFGRREPEHQALLKKVPPTPRRSEPCGCGSDLPFRSCCEAIPEQLRPSWTELSIRERNLGLYRAAVDIFGLHPDKTWIDLRREMTDEKIRRIYEVYAAVWPLETDLLRLLPKPDGRPRAVYTGMIHPKAIVEFAFGAGLYFGETIIEHPFVHGRTMRKDYSPIENPQAYRGEILKALSIFLTIIPLVEMGFVTLIPDPGAFDPHLREQTIRMAQARNAGRDPTKMKDDRNFAFVEEDGQRALMMQTPQEVLHAQFRKASPDLDDVQFAAVVRELERRKEQDPLAVLQPDPLPVGEAGAQLSMMKLSPNFEMAMYLAQATGSCIVTDSRHRFAELLEALMRRRTGPNGGAPALARGVGQAPLVFPQDPQDIARIADGGSFAPFPSLFADTARYLQGLEGRGHKPNYESQLTARFARARAGQDTALLKGASSAQARVHALLPERGIQDNTINRLLLMSSSEHHWASVPMAFFLEPLDAAKATE